MKVGETITKLIHMNSDVMKRNHWTEGTSFKMEFTVEESGAFQYGNQTSTTVKITAPNGEKSTEYYDTRYFVGELEDFAEQVIEDYLGWKNVDYVETLGVIKTFRYRFFADKQQVKQKTVHAETWDEADKKALEYMRKKRIDFDEWAGSLLK